MQDGAVLGDVDLLAAEHRVDPPAQAGLLGELDEQPQRLVGDAVLRVVEVEPDRLDGHALAASGVVGEQLAQMDLGHVLRMGGECRPRRWLVPGAHAFTSVNRVHIQDVERVGILGSGAGPEQASGTGAKVVDSTPGGGGEEIAAPLVGSLGHLQRQTEDGDASLRPHLDQGS